LKHATRTAREMLTRYRWFWLAAFAAFALSPAMNRIHDVLFYPWAHADPPLFDRWAGGFTAGNGDRLDLVLVLHRHLASDGSICERCNQIEGTAVTCDARGAIRRYRVAGSPKDRQGRQLHIGASPSQSPPPDGLELDTLIGTWDGADTLTLEADFFWRRGKSGISSTDDPATRPVPVRLQRQGTADAPVRRENLAPACA
jgi:hypothetical protein